MTELISKKQEQFCREYLKDFNATQAAIRAGYSEKSARQQAADLLTKPNIFKFIESLREKYALKSEITIEDVLIELSKIAFNTADGDLLKNSDKLKALDLLGKYLGMFIEKNIAQQDIKIDVKVLLVNKISNNNYEQGEEKRLE